MDAVHGMLLPQGKEEDEEGCKKERMLDWFAIPCTAAFMRIVLISACWCGELEEQRHDG